MGRGVRVKRPRWRILIGTVLAAGAAAQAPTIRQATFEERPALVMANGALELHVLPRGASLAGLTLSDDPEKINPMWNPVRMARELGQQPGFGDSLGHFVCVDGFGPVSPAEQAAGLRGHGEAHRLPFEVRFSGKEAGATKLAMSATLPLEHGP